jgi:Ca-activated chloride channel family protein
MQRLSLTGQILAAGARLIVQHVFRSEEEKALEVIYSFPLPRDAAIRRFRITGDGFDSHSELKETEAAIKAYEEGIARGSLSALARQYGDGVVNLTVGNIRPGETVTVWLELLAGVELNDDGFRFRFPFTLAPCYHPNARVAIISPGEAEMELPDAEFGDLILPRFREDPSALHQIGFDVSLTSALELYEVGSPSHAVRIKQEASRTTRITLAPANDVPDRDLVLDARMKSVTPQILGGRDKDGVGHFAVIAPSANFGASPEKPRRIAILLDRSGSMAGAPIAQARKAIEACLGALSDSDAFGLVAFDNFPEVFHPALQQATLEARNQAREFLNRIDARGGTELVQGVLAAAKLLGSGGDILILTDGQVSGTERILEIARSIGVRLHCLGIGSASQDRFLTLLARETGGVGRFVTPRERVDLSAVDLFASIGHPIATGLKASANVLPPPPPSVFSGNPVLLFGEGDGPVDLSWDGGRLDLPLSFTDDTIAETLRLLQGARLITDWESRYPSTEAFAPLEKRRHNRIATRLRELSRTYELASREMSLVAVVNRAGDRPGELPETRIVAVGVPQDADFDARFGNFVPAQSAFFAASASGTLDAQAPVPFTSFFKPAEAAYSDISSKFISTPPAPSEAARTLKPDEVLLELASRMEPDGGLPGPDSDSRAGASLVALLAFLSQGHTARSGTFRSHVARLLAFLKSLNTVSKQRRQTMATILGKVEAGWHPVGNWCSRTPDSAHSWDEMGQVQWKR